MFYSKLTGGFYSTDIHGENMPEDVVEITTEQHASLLQAQSEGASIAGNDDGLPVATYPSPPTQEQIIVAASEAVRFALQKAIDVKAHEFGFSGGNALMLYVGFENAFQPLAQVFAEWEASVWVQASEYRELVLAQTAPMLSPEEAVEMMPEIVWPS